MQTIEIAAFYDALACADRSTILSEPLFAAAVAAAPSQTEQSLNVDVIAYEAEHSYNYPLGEIDAWRKSMMAAWAAGGDKFLKNALKQLRKGPKRPVVVSAERVPYEPPKWTLRPYFQRGKGTLIQADPGTGKTAFMCAIAAHVTTGLPILGLPVETPGNVLMLSVEDDLPVLRGRVEASGGDVSRCFFMQNAAGLTFNSPEVEQAVQQLNAKMLIFDPLQAFLGAKVDMFRSNETRPELAKLFDMCDRNDCACVIVSHLSKSSGDKSVVNRALGSVDIPAAMRSVLHIIQNPENDMERIAVHVKCSNAPRGKSLVYTIGERGGVTWCGFSPMTVEDLATVQKRKEKRLPYENEPLVQVFNQLITDRPGGGFWSYADLKSEGAKILGFPPFSTTRDLKYKLDSGLARELQDHDGLIVTCGARTHGGIRGVKIERYTVPEGYQKEMSW